MVKTDKKTAKIVNRVYEEFVEQVVRVLFEEMMNNRSDHAEAEQRFRIGLEMAARARDCVNGLIEKVK